MPLTLRIPRRTSMSVITTAMKAAMNMNIIGMNSTVVSYTTFHASAGASPATLLPIPFPARIDEDSDTVRVTSVSDASMLALGAGAVSPAGRFSIVAVYSHCSVVPDGTLISETVPVLVTWVLLGMVSVSVCEVQVVSEADPVYS